MGFNVFSVVLMLLSFATEPNAAVASNCIPQIAEHSIRKRKCEVNYHVKYNDV